MKKDTTWNVGEITVVNYWKPHMEQSKIYYNGAFISSGSYTWSNRTRQRYDYENSLRSAYYNMIDKMSRCNYKYMKKGLALVKKILDRMHDYNWSNRSCEL